MREKEGLKKSGDEKMKWAMMKMEGGNARFLKEACEGVPSFSAEF